MYRTVPWVSYIMDLLVSKIINANDSKAYVEKFDLKCKNSRQLLFKLLRPNSDRTVCRGV
jgi:hypothetical protein